ncbi:MAG: hypothetical protein Kow0042_09700 [Calditrichia bacterium]
MQRNYTLSNQNDSEIMLSRRQARRLALQILFCNEFLHEDIHSVADRVAKTLEQDINGFCRRLIETTTEHTREFDELILKNLKGWDIERIAILDRVLIRLALCELVYFKDIPVEVTLDEALELSKEFISRKSSRFVNGILDTILKQLQKQNAIEKVLVARIPSSAKHSRQTAKDLES